MSLIGQQLLQPENGWERYDDTNSYIEYTGTGWGIHYNSAYYNGTLHYIPTNPIDTDVTARFKFKGTDLRFIASVHTEYTTDLTCTIDGVEYPSFSVNSGTSHQKLMFEVTGLVSKIHEAVFKAKNDLRRWSFDAIDINEDGELVDIDAYNTKHLIKSSNKIHTLLDNALTYPNLSTPTQEQFEQWGMDALEGYEKEVSKVAIEMNEAGVLEDGRVVRKTINKNEWKINGMGVR
ncbi:hypothetical protein SAMN05446037_100659 [Anaerovirgula multivorans]|uniref:Uncharacterized protein n=1 Tax=Anaerovirgula multivorans TaxID=312168 RepID=A0A239CP29_9FIRM|nr:hypothetical protein [Anaerovirgula multivorans]SNS21498.1 hypothetical protein SAMN05446037_100659 [Anaerovirgula multivorans]